MRQIWGRNRADAISIGPIPASVLAHYSVFTGSDYGLLWLQAEQTYEQ